MKYGVLFLRRTCNIKYTANISAGSISRHTARGNPLAVYTKIARTNGEGWRPVDVTGAMIFKVQHLHANKTCSIDTDAILFVLLYR